MDTRRSAAALSPIKSVTPDGKINIAGKIVDEHNINLRDAAIVIGNFRSLVFGLLPQDTRRDLKLTNVGEYNISFFNSPGDDRTQIIYKDDLLAASLDAEKALESQRICLQRISEKLKQERLRLGTQITEFKARKQKLLQEQARLTQELERLAQPTPSTDVSEQSLHEAELENRRNFALLEEARSRLNYATEHLQEQEARFEKEKTQYFKAYNEHSGVVYEVIQLGNGSASYGTNVLADDEREFTEASHAQSRESAVASDVSIFRPTYSQHPFSAETTVDITDSEIRLRVFKALIDLKKIAEELMEHPQESKLVKALVTAKQELLPAASMAVVVRAPEPQRAISIFLKPESFMVQMREMQPAVDMPPRPATALSPVDPLRPRPPTARFRLDSAIPPIAAAEVEEDGDGAGAAADHTAPIPLAVADIVAPPPSPASTEEIAAEEEFEYADDFEEGDETASDNESEESSQPTPDEEEEAKTAPLDAAALDQLTANITFDDDSDEDEEEPSPADAARADEPETAAERNARLEAGKRAVAASMEKLRRRVLGLDAPKAKIDKDRGAEAAGEKALTEARMWNFATYIYAGHLKSKQSVSNDKGYCNIQNRGTARAKHKDDIIIMAKTTTAPLILHCRRPNSFKLFEINEKTGKKALVDTFDAQHPEKFDNFINNVAAIKGLTEAQKEKVLQGEMKIGAKPKPPAARPATSRAAGGRASSAYKSPAAAIATSPYAKAPAATASSATTSSATAPAEKTPLRPTPPPPRPTTAAARPTTAARPKTSAVRHATKSTSLAGGNTKSNGQIP